MICKFFITSEQDMFFIYHIDTQRFPYMSLVYPSLEYAEPKRLGVANSKKIVYLWYDEAGFGWSMMFDFLLNTPILIHDGDYIDL